MIIVAYAKALEKLTGADVDRILRIPDADKKKFPEAAKCKDKALHTIMFRRSPENYRELERFGTARIGRTGRNSLRTTTYRSAEPGRSSERRRSCFCPEASIPDKSNGIRRR